MLSVSRSGQPAQRWLEASLLVVVLVYATALRSWHLASAPLWTDEAESSINALTILQHGIPRHEYVGIPVFENTLIQPWPEHAEFEFRDTSYSATGLAVYHGWLPLYAVAASFAWHGVTPDEPSADLKVRHSTDEMYRLTRAARVPSILFGVVFLGALYLAGRELYGKEAGWTAIATAAVSTTTVTLARQARYYSLTLALTALVAWMLVRVAKGGKRRDFICAGVLMASLFHTNALAFVGALGASALLLPIVWKCDGSLQNVALFAAIVVAGVLPWMLATGYLAAASVHPSALSLLTPADLFSYVEDRKLFVSIAVAALGWILFVKRVRHALPDKIRAPFDPVRWELFFLVGWTAIAFAAFTVLIPAASHFHSRLTLALFVPAVLFGAVLFAALARTITWHASWVAPILLVGLMAASGRTTFWWPAVSPGHPAIFQVVDHLRDTEIRPGTVLYANTGVSLILRVYTGLPFRSVLPVRRAFLDAHQGDILLVESPAVESLSWPEVQMVLGAAGHGVSPPRARRVTQWFNDHIVRERLLRRGLRVSPLPPQAPDPAFLDPLLAYQQQKTRRAVQEVIEETGNPIFRGHEIADYTELWQVFFYRFVNPETRMGPHLNYAARVAGADAVILPRGWVVIRVRGEPA